MPVKRTKITLFMGTAGAAWLVGNMQIHGRGWQADPFILVPSGLAPPDAPLIGAPALYRQLVAWQRDADPS